MNHFFIYFSEKSYKQLNPHGVNPVKLLLQSFCLNSIKPAVSIELSVTEMEPDAGEFY